MNSTGKEARKAVVVIVIAYVITFGIIFGGGLEFAINAIKKKGKKPEDTRTVVAAMWDNNRLSELSKLSGLSEQAFLRNMSEQAILLTCYQYIKTVTTLDEFFMDWDRRSRAICINQGYNYDNRDRNSSYYDWINKPVGNFCREVQYLQEKLSENPNAMFIVDYPNLRFMVWDDATQKNYFVKAPDNLKKLFKEFYPKI